MQRTEKVALKKKKKKKTQRFGNIIKIKKTKEIFKISKLELHKYNTSHRTQCKQYNIFLKNM